MNISKLLILVSTVTLLGACGGNKKGSQPNMVGKDKTKVSVDRDGFYSMAGQCASDAMGMNKKQFCTYMHDEMLGNKACSMELATLFKVKSCEAEVDTRDIEHLLSRVINDETEDNQVMVLPEEAPVVTVELAETETVLISVPEVVEEEVPVQEAPYIVVEEPAPAPVVVVEQAEPPKKDLDVQTVFVGDLEDDAAAAETATVETPAVEVQVATAPVEAAKPEEKKGLDVQTVFVGDIEAEIAAAAATVQSVQTVEIIEEKTPEGVVTSLEDISRRNDDKTKITATVNVPMSLPLGEKVELACLAMYQAQCEKTERSENKVKRCVRDWKRQDLRSCKRKTKKKYLSKTN